MGDAENVINVERLGKRYTLRQRASHRSGTLREAITACPRALARGVFGRRAPDDSREAFWAIKDLSFDVKRGEVVGVIGRNGAGKSTLLKILSRITEPTTGRIEIEGRVASLLEVGTGFHPELSGRENIFLNGSILGMKRAEIRRKFDEIVAFAEVERFLDTPVKRYSSGMYVRLAFAVAAHLEPEILIIDEVLAVGDMAFQQKCLGKMGDVARDGRTVIFVSHNMAVVNSLCHTAVYLDGGKLVHRGPTAVCLQRYLADTATPQPSGVDADLPVEDEDLRVTDFWIHDQAGKPKSAFLTSEPVHVSVRYAVHQPRAGLRVGIDVCDPTTGTTLFRTFDDDLERRDRRSGSHLATCVIPPNLLRPGPYAVQLKVTIHFVRWITHNQVVRRFHMEHGGVVNAAYGDSRPGVIMPSIAWTDQPAAGAAAGESF